MRLNWRMPPGSWRWFTLILASYFIFAILVLSIDWTEVYIFIDRPAPVEKVTKKPKKKPAKKKPAKKVAKKPVTIAKKAPKTLKKTASVPKVVKKAEPVKKAVKPPAPVKPVRALKLRKDLIAKANTINKNNWRKFAPQKSLQLEKLLKAIQKVDYKVLREKENEIALLLQLIPVTDRLVVEKVKAEREANRVELMQNTLAEAEKSLKAAEECRLWDVKEYSAMRKEALEMIAQTSILTKHAHEKALINNLKSRITVLKERYERIKKELRGVKPLNPEKLNVNLSKQQLAEADKIGLPVMVENSVGMPMVLIPAGTFKMGSPEGEADRNSDEKQHTVTISKPFYLAVYETTHSQFSMKKALGRPVCNINWKQASEYCKKLTLRERSEETPYQLPTEAQWEYAARAGTTGTRYESSLEAIAISGKAFQGASANVGSKAPNAWGVFDIFGNVKEWTRDLAESSFFGRSLPATYVESIKDPVGTKGDNAVVRGGGWDSSESSYRAAYRELQHPDIKDRDLGFRVMRQINVK